jgi:hypothetical protein
MSICRDFVEWPREESNLRTRIRSPPLYPLSYGARRQSSLWALDRIRKRPARLGSQDVVDEHARHRLPRLRGGAADVRC